MKEPTMNEIDDLARSLANQLRGFPPATAAYAMTKAMALRYPDVNYEVKQDVRSEHCGLTLDLKAVEKKK